MKVAPGSDTRVAIDTSDPRAVMLRPAHPASSPAVIARLVRVRGEVRIRVPVTRVALVTAAGGFDGWKTRHSAISICARATQQTG